MPNYRRLYLPGSWYFFTLVTDHRRPILTTEQGIAAFRAAVTETRIRHPFESIAWVILPDHLHYIWHLPEGDSDFSVRWSVIKWRFTRHFMRSGGRSSGRTESRKRHREQAVWQRRFWEHCLPDEEDLSRHIDYIHYNPMKHGLVKEPLLWRLSSAHWPEYIEPLRHVRPELAEIELPGVE